MPWGKRKRKFYFCRTCQVARSVRQERMLTLSCTHGEYLAASPEDQRDFNRRLLESWRRSAERTETSENVLDTKENDRWS